MHSLKKAAILVVGLTLVTFNAALAGGACCKTPVKDCPNKKKCITVEQQKNCPVKKSCDSAQATSNPEAKTPGKSLLFFINPNGRPCQMQLEVLENMKDKLAPIANVTLIKTTEGADRNKFSQYGIRGLPSLIIVDGSGKELSRFQPGIQDEKTILNALSNNAGK